MAHFGEPLNLNSQLSHIVLKRNKLSHCPKKNKEIDYIKKLATTSKVFDATKLTVEWLTFLPGQACILLIKWGSAYFCIHLGILELLFVFL